MLRQLVVLAVVGLALSAPSSKIDGALAGKSTAHIAVAFKQTPDSIFSRVNSLRFATRAAKVTYMKTQLEQLAASSQANALSIVQASKANFRSTWINNELYVKDASVELIQEIANLPEVVSIREQARITLVRPESSDNQIQAEWGIDKIEAEAAWALPGGNNGEGVVVGVIDTGARNTHETLRNNFRAEKGWFDADRGRPAPHDGDGHGTHCTGTILGSNGIGVAPGAQWISCKGLDDNGSGYESDLVKCGEFMVCPTLPDGSGADCSLGADIVSNSWGGGSIPGYNAVVTAWHTAGITPVFAIGNSGRCTSTIAPGNFANVIGVGSTDNADKASSFTSKGPTSDGRMKPEVSAPGSNIRSAGIASDTAYATLSGTSMATPHVAGTIALLKSRNPNLTYEQIKDLLQNNTEQRLGADETCGGIPSDRFPNHVYGHGRISARASLAAAISAY